MIMLLSLNIILSLSFLFMIHPLSMGMILLMQTIVISLITGFFNFNYWFSYILFLIMIGGMLVLFIYMTSIASNEKFKYNNKIMMMMIGMTFIMLMILIFIDDYMLSMNIFQNMIYKNNSYLMLAKFYNKPSNMIMFLMIIYLFITLIAVVKITDFKLGPLRQKF
uniref:NADH-ubiquinone oxidoreductase chain 6 n=1 Tax=Ochthebius hasegawai TaxID=1309151 RepID=A0A7H0DKE2_9COLE|nr:NADH dehydrogenase subunit 6 [Ochthebius hasegawai]QNP09802.1 NADH dehydrogenase subunit 6 [Ochthebius hasegawai]